MQLVIKTLGPPSEDDLTFINSQKARAYIRALPPSEVSATPPTHTHTHTYRCVRGHWAMGGTAHMVHPG